MPMPYSYTSLDDFEGQWRGRIVRISRIVSKPSLQQELLAAVTEATNAATGVDRAFVGNHKAPGGRAVVLLMSVWESPDKLRGTENQSVPLGYDRYSHLVESWTMEYFEEYLDTAGRTPHDHEPSDEPAPHVT
jgi:hypothetical protein